MPAAPAGKKRHALLGQRRQVLISAGNVLEWIAAEDRADRLGVGIDVEDQIRLRLGLPVFTLKGVVEQVIEDLAIQAGFFTEVIQESGERIARFLRRERRARHTVAVRAVFLGSFILKLAVRAGPGIAHAQGQFAQLVVAARQAMGLQIEQKLQAMLGLAQKTVGVGQQPGLFGR